MMMKGGSSSSNSIARHSEGLRQFFGWLESRFGGLVWDTGPSAEVIFRSDGTLHAEDVGRLMRHEATALHVQGFFPIHAAQMLGHQLAQDASAGLGRNWKVSTSRGLESSDVSTLGEHPPFNVATAQGTQAVQEYFDAVPREMQSRRGLVDGRPGQQPTLWPLDLLRLELDRVWPAGAGLARDEKNRVFSGGLPRIMEGPTRWKKGYIHVDEMGPLHPHNGLFSANVYLQLPESYDNHPEDDNKDNTNDNQDILQIWPVGIRSRWDWYRNAVLLSGLSSQDPEDQARLRVALGTPTTVRARPGDLVLLCAQRPHAAIGFQSGIRVSLQCFVQHNGPKERLLMDS